MLAEKAAQLTTIHGVNIGERMILRREGLWENDEVE
jgi:hypothetical protein